AFVAEFPIEALDLTILGGFPRVDEMEGDPFLAGPGIESGADEFRAVVDADALRLAPHRYQHGDNALTGERRVHLDHQALTSQAVDDVERPEGPAASGTVVHEVHRPGFVRPRRLRELHARHRRELLALLAPHQPAILAHEPQYKLPVDRPALPLEHHVQPPVSEAWPLHRDLPQIGQQLRSNHPSRAITHRSAPDAQRPANPPLAALELLSQMAHRQSSRRGPHHFFESTSFNIALSSAWSATSFFSRRFSSSSCFSRRASLTSIPPNFFFQ